MEYVTVNTLQFAAEKIQNLVWSGACQFQNKNTADFRPSQNSNGLYQLSAIEIGLFAGDRRKFGDGSTVGRGIILDDAYRDQAEIKPPHAIESFNMHELRLVNGGMSAIHILWRPEYVDISELRLDRKAGWIGNMGFREVDIASGKTTFEWWALDHVRLEHSSRPMEGIEGPAPTAWNYIYVDSVDKNDYGDYLVSGRHTDSIYKISGDDGSVLWQLSGNNFSSFEMQDLSFYRQHDARFVKPYELGLMGKEGLEYVSVFNNAADDLDTFAHVSSVLMIELNTSTMTAKTIRTIDQPGASLSRYSGNAHLLANGNVFVGWGGNGYVSEHCQDGEILFEAHFQSNRFANYRAYKSQWVGAPSEDELAVRCFAHGTSPEKATTICSASWNGATEVQYWTFNTATGNDSTEETVPRDGFETTIHMQGFYEQVYVEALGIDKSVLIESTVGTTVVSKNWR